MILSGWILHESFVQGVPPTAGSKVCDAPRYDCFVHTAQGVSSRYSLGPRLNISYTQFHIKFKSFNGQQQLQADANDDMQAQRFI